MTNSLPLIFAPLIFGAQFAPFNFRPSPNFGAQFAPFKARRNLMGVRYVDVFHYRESKSVKGYNKYKDFYNILNLTIWVIYGKTYKFSIWFRYTCSLFTVTPLVLNTPGVYLLFTLIASRAFIYFNTYSIGVIQGGQGPSRVWQNSSKYRVRKIECNLWELHIQGTI